MQNDIFNNNDVQPIEPVNDNTQSVISNKKKNTFTKVLIIFLVLVIIGSGFYILYDKGIIFNSEKEVDKPSNNSKDNNVNNSSSNDLGKDIHEKTIYIKDYYYGCSEPEVTDGESLSSCLLLVMLDNGNFYSRYSAMGPVYNFGSYEIKDSEIILNAKYSHGSGCGFSKIDSQFTYEIRSDGVFSRDYNILLNRDDSYTGKIMDKEGLCTENIEEAKTIYDMGFIVNYTDSNDTSFLYNGSLKTISQE